jgi:hypothetical protein
LWWPAEGPVTQVKNLTGSQVVVKVGKYISCFSSQNSLSFQFKTIFETVSQFPNASLLARAKHPPCSYHGENPKIGTLSIFRNWLQIWFQKHYISSNGTQFLINKHKNRGKFLFTFPDLVRASGVSCQIAVCQPLEMPVSQTWESNLKKTNTLQTVLLSPLIPLIQFTHGQAASPVQELVWLWHEPETPPYALKSKNICHFLIGLELSTQGCKANFNSRFVSMSELELFLLMGVLDSKLQHYGPCKNSWKKSQTSHSDRSGLIEGDIIQNHEQKRKVKKSEKPRFYGQNKLFFENPALQPLGSFQPHGCM